MTTSETPNVNNVYALTQITDAIEGACGYQPTIQFVIRLAGFAVTRLTMEEMDECIVNSVLEMDTEDMINALSALALIASK